VSPTQAVAADWDRGLTTILERCARRWSLHIGRLLPCGQSSRVFACTDQRGRAAVIKVVAHEAGAALEAAALRIWNGRGAPRLLGFAGEDGALLLERLRPGTHLPAGADAQAIQRVKGTLAGLHGCRPQRGHSFPSLVRFLDSYWDWVLADGQAGTAGLELLDQSRAAAAQLCRSAQQNVLLHGDFIDKNLLLGAGGFVAVDPIPRVGDPCSDVGFYAAYHPPASAIAARARAFGRAVGYDAERCARWAAVWAAGEAAETWRTDSAELQVWMRSAEARSLLEA